MLSSQLIQEISVDVRKARRVRKLGIQDLALDARVGDRFVARLEAIHKPNSPELKWKRELVFKLLRVLKALELLHLVEEVKTAIVVTGKSRKKKRYKFDRRLGGQVLSRRCRH